jgi:D-alanyl-lipoteichoic acid acyltransferase DltB (MBOAT superfamily)
MLFTSIIYFLFLAASVLVYYLIPAKYRNLFLIAISVWFYMYVKVSYIFIILFVILINYWLGILIGRTVSKQRKKGVFYLSLLVNLSVLIFFKYWNFLILNLFELFGWLHLNNSVSTPFLDIALPIGLSYYIFQTIGYITDIKRGTIPAETNFYRFTLFTIYFPKLLVGPIERANHFLPQLKRKISFDKENITEGAKRIAWGLFKKLVVADRIAIYHSKVIITLEHQSGGTIFLASVLYTFQVYADFSGYTDIALGTARMFGFNLMENFKRPLLAKNLGDFWRRWHISLSSWVNDYIFNPIALSYRDWRQWGVFYALFVSFVVIGIWHGAAWTYVFFGVLQAIALIYETATRRTRKRISKKINSKVYNIISILFTFLFVTFSLIIFQSKTIGDGFEIIHRMFTNSGHLYLYPSIGIFMITGCAIMMIYDLQEEYRIWPFSLFSNKSWLIQEVSYALLLIYILFAGVFDGGQFIYFAF